jgi:hypothetical protein
MLMASTKNLEPKKSFAFTVPSGTFNAGKPAKSLKSIGLTKRFRLRVFLLVAYIAMD